MPVIVVTLPSDGDNAIAANVDNPINAILAVVNGNLDDDNIASMNGSKIVANSLPASAFNAANAQGWIPLSAAPTTVSALGNRSYSLVFNSLDLSATLSKGMRLKLTRTVTAPLDCASLNGTNQFFNKTSPAGMTFTDDFAVSAWIKLTSYAAGGIVSRYNGTSGWYCRVNASGQIELAGFNASSSNFVQLQSYQSIPLNKWVHVAAQLDMSGFSTVSPTTSYVMIDGVDVPAVMTRGGTNPTALIQAGNLEVGSFNGGTQPFPGKLAQVAVYNAKVTEATMLAAMSQTLAGTETSLISAYTLSNSVTDLNTSNNNGLTAQNSATTTTADNPFADSTGLLDYAIVTNVAFSTNTTLTVQTHEGATIPSSGGITSAAYSTQKTPFNFPVERSKWAITSLYKSNAEQTSPSVSTWYNVNSAQLNIPLGAWAIATKTSVLCIATSGTTEVAATLSTANNSESDSTFTGFIDNAPSTRIEGSINIGPNDLSLSVATIYYRNLNARTATSPTDLYDAGATNPSIIRADLAYL